MSKKASPGCNERTFEPYPTGITHQTMSNNAMGPSDAPEKMTVMLENRITKNMTEENNRALPPLLYDVRAAAARLSISVVSIRKLIRQGRIRRVPDFRKILISETELQHFAAYE